MIIQFHYSHVLKLYTNIKKIKDDLTKKCKELTKEISILKFDNDIKSFQYKEQCNQVELLKETNNKLTTDYDSLKSTYDTQINELRIKYENVCRVLNYQNSKENTQGHEKNKRDRKRSKLPKIHHDSSVNEYFSEDDQNNKLLNVSSDNSMHTIKIGVLSDSSNVSSFFL